MLSFSALNYVQAGLSFLISMTIASYLGKDTFGLYSYGLIFMSSLITLGSFGTDKTLVRDLVQEVENREQFMLSNSLFKLILGILLVFIVISWAALRLDSGEKQMVVVGFSITAIFMLISPRQWYDYVGKIHLNAKLGVVERLACLIGVFCVVLWVESHWMIWIAAILLGSKLLLAAVEWTLIYQQLTSGWKNLSTRFSDIFKSNSWIWFAAIGNLLMLQYNQFILEGSYGIGELATFGLAFQLIQLIILLQGQILRLSTPEIADVSGKLNKNDISKELLRTSGYVLTGSILLAIPFYLFAPYFVQHVIGKDFNDAIPVFNILLIWVLIYGVAAINNQFLISLHLQKPYFVITMIFGVLSIFLAYYFVGKYGAVGAALSLLIAHGGSILTQIILVKRHINKLDTVVAFPNK